MSIRVPHSPRSQSSVLYERGWRRYEAHSPAGALSIKCMVGGAAHYETRLGRFRVDDSRYLILNHGTPYTITINSRTPMDSFCIFFAPDFVESILRAHTTPQESLLGDPGDNGHAPATGFFERTYPHDRTLTPALKRLRKALVQGRREAAWWDEQLHGLTARLLTVHGKARGEAARLPAAKAATRAELYRRLHRARDYMEASLSEPLPLAQVARVAAMAPHHFLRAFRHAFHTTPHQYLTSRRLDRARQLLAGSDLPVTQICLDVGFSSLGSFSWLFRRHMGLSPEAFRKQHRPN